jgi:hypothetical protein
MKTYYTESELTALSGDTEGATLYIDPPQSTPWGVSLIRLVKRAMEALESGPCSVEIQLADDCWLNSDQIRRLATRFGETTGG